MEAESKARCEAQKQLAHTLVNVTDEDTTDELEAVYNRDMEAAVKIAERNLRKETQEVQHIQHLLNVVQNIDGSDEEIRENFSTAQRRPTRCPILNCALENPLKNTKCGHVYSLKGAISLLFQKNAARSRTLPSTIDRVPSSYTAQCPCHGCPGVVRRDWLKRDFATELSQRQLQSVRRDSMDVEELL